LAERCAGDGVLVDPLDPVTLRLVLHRDVDDEDVQRAAAVLNSCLGGP
jgi:hypothetical protein